MSANQAAFPVAVMARVLGVSKAGFYAWRERAPSARQVADGALLARVQDVHVASRDTYGAPRVHAALQARGERHGRKRIARLMRVAGLVGACHRKGGPTTTRRDQEARPAPDLVDRNFKARAPDQLWVADITYVPTMSGFLYLAVVLDVFSRRIVGWSMQNHLRTEADRQCARHGCWATQTERRDPSLRPGLPIYIAGFWKSMQGSRRSPLDRLRRRRLRQRYG